MRGKRHHTLVCAEVFPDTPTRLGDRRSFLLSKKGLLKKVGRGLRTMQTRTMKRRGMDAETFSLSHNPDFIEIINRSWRSYRAKGSLSTDEVRRRLGLTKSR